MATEGPAATIAEAERLLQVLDPRFTVAHAVIRDLLALVRPQEGWQPIETAPKDGTTVILCYPTRVGQYVKVGHFSEKRQQWWCDVGDVPATHWMPLPAAPSSTPEGGQGGL